MTARPCWSRSGRRRWDGHRYAVGRGRSCAAKGSSGSGGRTSHTSDRGRNFGLTYRLGEAGLPWIGTDTESIRRSPSTDVAVTSGPGGSAPWRPGSASAPRHVLDECAPPRCRAISGASGRCWVGWSVAGAVATPLETRDYARRARQRSSSATMSASDLTKGPDPPWCTRCGVVGSYAIEKP